jgi:hypothetical protein
MLENERKTLEAIYNFCIHSKTTIFPELFETLNIHPIHKPGIGVWTSSPDVAKNVPNSFDFPSGATGGLVIPCYDKNNLLTNLQVIYKNSKDVVNTASIGNSGYGWFNLLGAKHAFQKKEARFDAGSKRLFIYQDILKVLKTADGVWAANIQDYNLDNLKDITCKLALVGKNEFIKKFEPLWGWDITIGNTEISIWDKLQNNFIFEDLQGLDMRAVIGKCIEQAKTLSLWERDTFREKVQTVFKIDLREVAPLLFARSTDERAFYQKLVEVIQKKYQFEVVDFVNGHPITKISINKTNIILRQATKKMFDLLKDKPIPITPTAVANYITLMEGDLLEFVTTEVAPIPAVYRYDRKTQEKLTIPTTYEIIKNVLFQAVLGLVNGTNKASKLPLIE